MRAPLLVALAILALAPAAAFAEAPEEKGQRIMVMARQHHGGFGDLSVEIVMVRHRRDGDDTVRHLRRKAVEVDGDGSKSLLIFDGPADIRGTALLTFAHATGPHDQWLYLPALDRAKRIRSPNGWGPLIGSELAYLDPLSQYLGSYAYKWQRDETCAGGLDCWVLEATPVDETAGLARHVLWIDKAAYRVHKIDLHGRAGALQRSLSFADYRRHLGRHWRAGRLSVVDRKTGMTTIFTFHNYAFATGLTDLDRDTIARAGVRERALAGGHD